MWHRGDSEKSNLVFSFIKSLQVNLFSAPFEYAIPFLSFTYSIVFQVPKNVWVLYVSKWILRFLTHGTVRLDGGNLQVPKQRVREEMQVAKPLESSTTQDKSEGFFWKLKTSWLTSAARPSCGALLKMFLISFGCFQSSWMRCSFRVCCRYHVKYEILRPLLCYLVHKFHFPLNINT